MCNRFDGTTVPVAIVSPSIGAAIGERLLSSPWRLVVDFDPATDHTGPYHKAKSSDVSSRLVTVGQEPHFGRGTTTWLAVNGLDGQAPSALRDWRTKNLPTVRLAFQGLALSAASPIVVVVFGEVDAYVRATVEAALDAADQRTRIVQVDPSARGQLQDYDGVPIEADALQVVDALPPRNLAAGNRRELSIPGIAGPVPISRARMSWLEDAGDVLHSEAGTMAVGPGRPGEAFYRGRQISWLELDIGIDLERSVTGEVLARVLADLEGRDPRRVSLHHYPGAGGTTLGRRVAWDVHWRFPVLVASQAHDPAALASRVRELSEMSDLAVLVVLDVTGENVIERLYSSLRVDSVPFVLLIVGRRTTEAGQSRAERAFISVRLNEATIVWSSLGGSRNRCHTARTRCSNSRHGPAL